MDFRSQLSALSGKNGGGGGRVPNRSNNSGSSNNYYGRGGGGGNSNYGNQRNHQDRRRPRGAWNNQQGGPPSSRRRYHSPDRDGLGELRNLGYRIPHRGGVGGEIDSSRKEKPNKKTKHLALLAITIDDLPYEHIWKEFCKTTGKEDGSGNNDDLWISLVCHAKFPKRVQSEWLRQRLLVYPPKLGRGNSFLDPEYLSRTPSWGSVEITRAMIDLLDDSMRIGNCKHTDMRFSTRRYVVKEASREMNPPPVDQFLFISETCLPVATAREVFETISDPGISWVNGRHRKGSPDTPKNKYESDQFGGIHRRIPGQYRWKADQWILLCREHAEQILNIDRPHMQVKHQLWNSFRDINASDEMYFPTCLGLLGLLRYTMAGTTTGTKLSVTAAIPPAAASNVSMTGTFLDNASKSRDGGGDKQDQDPAGTPNGTQQQEVVLKRAITYTDWSEGMRNPATFTKGLEDFARVAKVARGKGCLMARKFAPFVPVPGVKHEEQVITGQLSVEEWFQAIQGIHLKDEQDEPPQEKRQASEEAEDVNGAEPEKDDTPSADKVDAEEGEPESDQNDDGKNEDEEDDDIGEQELE